VQECSDKAEGTACALEGVSGWCHDGVCLPIDCGNSRQDLGEACDDGDTESGDGCSGNCTSNETCGNGIVDPLRVGSAGPTLNEECDDGNRMSHDECSSDCRRESFQWQKIESKPPPALMFARAAYDTARRRVVMFGGQSTPTTAGASSATYEWNGAGWSRVDTANSPPARADHGMAYDAARRRVVIFGGHLGEQPFPTAAYEDTWEWDGAQWRMQTPATSPSARFGVAMTYDSARKVVVMFGGFYYRTSFDETWEWNGTNWRRVSTATTPPGREGAIMAYDPTRGVVVMASGRKNIGTQSNPYVLLNDTWEYNGTDWRQVTTTTPSPLACGAMTFEPGMQKLLAYGGSQCGPGTGSLSTSSKTFTFDGTTWVEQLGASASGVTEGQALVTDPVGGKVLMFGGDDGASPRTAVSTMYEWTGSAWAIVTPQPVIAFNALAAIAHDPLRGRAWMFGGVDDVARTNAMWSFDGLVWTRNVAGTSGDPAPRDSAVLAADPATGRVVLFGGRDTGGLTPSADTTVPAQTWLWDGATWTLASPAASPSARFGAAHVYDAGRGRLVMLGGYTGSAYLDEQWEFTGTNWEPIATTPRPSPRVWAPAAHDVVRDTMVVRGGIFSGGAATDLWELASGAWTKPADNTPLLTRAWDTIVYVPRLRSAIDFGGYFGSGRFDAWRWNGTMWTLIAAPSPPPGRMAHVAFPSVDGGGMVVAFGISDPDNLTPIDDTWELRAVNDSPRELCLISVDNDGDGLSGCADPDCWANCTPLCPPGAACDASAPHCGDNTCNDALETCRSCAQDCSCTARCGDFYCDAGETQAVCPGDCTP
jgi:cysteine-rich repeat protein